MPTSPNWARLRRVNAKAQMLLPPAIPASCRYAPEQSAAGKVPLQPRGLQLQQVTSWTSAGSLVDVHPSVRAKSGRGPRDGKRYTENAGVVFTSSYVRLTYCLSASRLIRSRKKSLSHSLYLSCPNLSKAQRHWKYSSIVSSTSSAISGGALRAKSWTST